MAPKVDAKIIEAMWKVHREHTQWSPEKIREELLKDGMKLSADTIRRQLKAAAADASTSADPGQATKRAKTTLQSSAANVDATTNGSVEVAPDIAGALQFMDAFRLGSDAAEIPAAGSALPVLGQRSSSTPSQSSTAKPEKESTGSAPAQSSTAALNKASTGKLNFRAAPGGSSNSEATLTSTPPSRSAGGAADAAKIASPPSVEKQSSKSAKGKDSQDDFVNALTKLNDLSYDDQCIEVASGGFGTFC